MQNSALTISGNSHHRLYEGARSIQRHQETKSDVGALERAPEFPLGRSVAIQRNTSFYNIKMHHIRRARLNGVMSCSIAVKENHIGLGDHFELGLKHNRARDTSFVLGHVLQNRRTKFSRPICLSVARDFAQFITASRLLGYERGRKQASSRMDSRFAASRCSAAHQY